MKIPLKIKNFLWFPRRGVTLTKDNLAKRNWQGNQQWCFCHENETIQHLFFYYRFTRMVWASVYEAWGIPKPRNMANMFGSWLNRVPKDFRPLVLVGAAALCWSVWLCRNGVVFDNKQSFFCRLFSQLRIGSARGLFFNGLLPRRCLWRHLFFWLRWPMFFLSGHMGGGLSLRIDDY